MKKIIPIILVSFLIFLLFTCEENKYSSPMVPFRIYQLKGDYIDKVCIMMNSDKTRIIATPSPNSEAGDTSCIPRQLDEGYYIDRSCNYGLNSAYLSITRKEFITWVYEVPVDSYMNYIIDKDPYLEYYIAKEPLAGDSCSVDTSYLNKLIKSNELEICFDRIK